MLRPTEQKQQKVVRYLEENKPLPEKFGNDTMTHVEVKE